MAAGLLLACPQPNSNPHVCYLPLLMETARFLRSTCEEALPCVQVHAEDEKEHAAIGHEAVTSLVPAELEAVAERAMHDHDRDFASFYSAMADLLEGKC